MKTNDVVLVLCGIVIPKNTTWLHEIRERYYKVIALISSHIMSWVRSDI